MNKNIESIRHDTKQMSDDFIKIETNKMNKDIESIRHDTKQILDFLNECPTTRESWAFVFGFIFGTSVFVALIVIF